ncbi:hypothetical protein OIU76_029741 [Salix suchowensis]|nr:hypothetical protein OIU76_029741 [Salix suchowensis]
MFLHQRYLFIHLQTSNCGIFPFQSHKQRSAREPKSCHPLSETRHKTLHHQLQQKTRGKDTTSGGHCLLIPVHPWLPSTNPTSHGQNLFKERILKPLQA